MAETRISEQFKNRLTEVRTRFKALVRNNPDFNDIFELAYYQGLSDEGKSTQAALTKLHESLVRAKNEEFPGEEHA